MAARVRVPMCMSDSSAQHLIEVSQPVTLEKIKDAAGKKLGRRFFASFEYFVWDVMMKFKEFRPKKGLAYHSFTGEELTEDLVPSLFTGVGSAAVVLSMKPWKGAAKLKAATDSKDSKGYGDSMPKPSLEGRTGSKLQRGADILQGCDALLVLVGAGMGVDSGLSTFRAQDGSYTKEEYMELARHASFREDIHKAWAWHGAMLQRFCSTLPHAGYAKLLEVCQQIGDFFICTSNIDGAFLRCSFPPDRVFEAHGSVHMWQCCDPKCTKNHNPWPAKVDEPESEVVSLK
eukprot:s1089_g17.t1